MSKCMIYNKMGTNYETDSWCINDVATAVSWNFKECLD